jgi:hypothetical protein
VRSQALRVVMRAGVNIVSRADRGPNEAGLSPLEHFGNAPRTMNHCCRSFLALALSLAASIYCNTHASAQTAPYALGSLPFGVSWPAAPKITRSVDVSTQADFNKAASVAGTLITVKTAISGRASITASDIEVHMASGASLGGLTISKALKRIALYGGHYTGTIELSQASQFYPSRVDNPAWAIEDVMIDGISVRSASTTALLLRGHRVALLRSFAYGADYAVYSDTVKNDQVSDIIIAGNNLQAEGRQATVRLINVRNSVTVDNRITDLLLTGSKHDYRVHGISDQVFAARNELVNGGVMIGTMSGDDVGHIWFDSNTLHHKTADMFNVNTTVVHVLHAHDNLAYSDVWSCFYCGRAPSGWDVANNVDKPYTDPPPAPAGMLLQ